MVFDPRNRQVGGGAQPLPQSTPAALPYNSRNPFERVGNANAQGGGIYPLPGMYPVLFVDTLKMKLNRKEEDVFIAEFDICQSEVAGRPPGTRMSWVANLKHDAAPGNVRMFIATLFGVPLEEVDGSTAELACGADNPARGRLIRLEASNIKTREKKQDFTLCRWITIPEDMQAQAKELRLAAGFPPF